MPDYGYFNARLRGMKSRLLPVADYERMLRASGLTELMAVVGRTPLKAALEKSLLRHEGITALEQAFKEDFVQACRKVLAIAEGEQRELVGLILRRWDVFNIKTILRGTASGAAPAYLQRSLMPAGELDEPSLRALGAQPGVKEVVDLLATWNHPLARPLVENLEGYDSDRNLVRLELCLDRTYCADGLRTTGTLWPNKRLVRDLIRSEIDIANVMAKIRLIQDDIDTFVETTAEKKARERQQRAAERGKLARPKPPSLKRKVPPAKSPRKGFPLPAIQDYFIPGGQELGGGRLPDLLRVRTMAGLLDLLRTTSFAGLVSVEMAELEKIPDLAAFERSLEADLIRKLTHLYRHEPLGIAMAVSYLWMKYNELVNLRIIGRGKEFDIPESILRSELVHAP